MDRQMEWLPPGVELIRDPAPASWLVERLEQGGLHLVGHFVPSGFDAYVRVFHPPGERPASSTARVDIASRWADYLAERGDELTPDVTFPDILGHQVDDANQPMVGTPPFELGERLIEPLGRHTTAIGGWFCLWEGNGSFRSGSHGTLFGPDATRREARRRNVWQDNLLRGTPRVVTPFREYFLCRGEWRSATAFYDRIGVMPNIWWPDDRAWVVVTEIDSYSTYVASARPLADELLASPAFETIEVTRASRIDPGI